MRRCIVGVAPCGRDSREGIGIRRAPVDPADDYRILPKMQPHAWARLLFILPSGNYARPRNLPPIKLAYVRAFVRNVRRICASPSDDKRPPAEHVSVSTAIGSKIVRLVVHDNPRPGRSNAIDMRTCGLRTILIRVWPGVCRSADPM